ncbi:MAG: inositol monophosphatase family protein [Chitinispirillaceae bacterium]
MRQLEVAMNVAREAGAFVKGMKGNAGIDLKAVNNLVTEADTASEKMIWELLSKEFPDSKFYGEENENRGDLDSESLWIVDPLDGTNNFAQGIPIYCVSIAYAQKGRVVCGCVYDPERDELFSAEQGKGAFLNGERISVSKRRSFEESMISVGFYYDRGEMMEKALCSVQRLFRKNIRGLRRIGSAAVDLCWLSCGRFDAYFEYMLSPWDFAAATLLLKEAGGEYHDRDGQLFNLRSTGIIASNGLFHDQFLEEVRWSGVENRFA